MQRIEISLEVAFLVLLSFLLGIISIYFFFGKEQHRLASKIIGCYFLFFFIAIFFEIFRYGNIDLPFNHRPFISFLDRSSDPLLYIYVMANVLKKIKLAQKDWILLLPTLTAIIYLSLYFINEDLYKSKIIAQINFIAGYLLNLLFAFLSIRLINKYKENVYENFSNLNTHNASWLSFIIYSTLIYIHFPFLWGALVFFTEIDFVSQTTLLMAGMTLFIYLTLILWKILQNAHIMEGIDEKELETKYASSNLPETEKQQNLNYLKSYMDEKQAFLNPDLKLKTIAQELKIPPRNLSQVINEKLNQNFYDFINSYRIEYAKNMLSNLQDKKMTILEVMYASGFNSKSSFNTAFKKITGSTPSEFKKKVA